MAEFRHLTVPKENKNYLWACFLVEMWAGRNAGFKAKSYSNLEQRQIHSPTLVGYYVSKCIKATWNCLFVHLTKFCMLHSFVLSILNVCMHPFYCTLASWKKFRLWIFFYFKPSEWFWPYWKTPPLTLLSRKYRHQFHAASNWFPIVSVFLTYALFTNLHCFHSSNDWCLKGSFLLSLSPCHMHFFFSNWTQWVICWATRLKRLDHWPTLFAPLKTWHS